MAVGFELSWEPLDAPCIEDAAEAATWARLRVSAGSPDQPRYAITEVHDRTASSVRDGVYGTVLPLAEWIVRSWSHVLVARRAEPGPRASADSRYLWSRVHRWRYAGEGTALPDVTFARLDDHAVDVRWTPDRDPAAAPFERVKFLSQGDLRIGIAELEGALAAFVEGVINRLRAEAPDHARTREMIEAWALVRNGASHDFHAQVIAARLGVFWWDMDEAARRVVGELAARPLDPVGTELLEGSRLEDAMSSLRFGRGVWNRCEEAPEPPRKWRTLREAIRAETPSLPAAAPPWTRGWESARAFRRASRISMRTPIRLDGVLPWVMVTSPRSLPGGAESVLAWRAERAPVRVGPRFDSTPLGRLHSRFS